MRVALEAELLALTRDDGSDTAEVPLVATALEVADPRHGVRTRIEDATAATASETPERDDAPPATRLRLGRGPAPAKPRARRGPGGRRLWPLALLVFVLVAGIGWAAYLGSSLSATTTTAPRRRLDDHRGRRPRPADDDGRHDGAQPHVADLTATSYDPTGSGGDGDEHPAETGNALDGDPSTRWRTDTYRGTAEFSGHQARRRPDPRPRPRRSLRPRVSLTGGLGGWTGRVYSRVRGRRRRSTSTAGRR